LVAVVTERELAIDNPFLFKTKAEVVQILRTYDSTDLISLTCSCSHLMFQSGQKRHCGTCSQCIDRRFAVAGAELLSKDPETDYVSDVFLGPRPKQLERSIAIDYTRHGIELERRSEAEIAGIFNAEISRAVRYETNRRESAEGLISMFKRHGTVVRQVLEEQVRLNAAKLIDRTLEETSLLALAMGQKYLPTCERLADITPEDQDSVERNEPSGAQSVILNRLNEMFTKFEARVGILAQGRKPRAKPSSPTKRDTILFAAIASDLKGAKYCDFLDKHKVKPKWSEDGPKGFRASYMLGGSYPKKVQDEKSRAKRRMSRHAESVLMDAFNTYLPSEFDQLSALLNSRNSRDASKN
jgi:hypothetical protein